MLTTLRSFLFCLVTLCLLPSVTWAQKQAQDTFVLERIWSHGLNVAVSGLDKFGIAVDYSNRAWIVNGSGVSVLDAGTGVPLTNWPVANAKSLRFDSISNLVWVCSKQSVSPQVRSYNSSYGLVAQWGTNSLSSPSGICVDLNGAVYIADSGNSRIMIFDRNGNFQRQFTVAPNFALDVGVSPDGYVFTPGGSLAFLKYLEGVLVQSRSVSSAGYGFTTQTIATSTDGLVYFGGYFQANSWWYGVVEDENLTDVVTGLLADGEPSGACFSPGGDRLYLMGATKVYVYRRCYRTTGANPPNPIPLPYVWNTSQRAGSTLIDTDFIVADGNNSNVACGAYALVNGQNNLLSFVPIKNLVNTNGATVTALTKVVTNVKQHFVWDAGNDWGAQFGYVKLVLQARDNRNLFDIHFITCPSNANPNVTFTNSITISQSPFLNSDFMSAWYWLLCTDPSVGLTNGNVFSTVNNYGVTNGSVLATTTASGTTNTTVTSSGLTFIFSLMSSNLASTAYSNQIIRIATTNEINQAKVGTSGNLTNVVKWSPRIQVNGLPQNINEFGFDTGFIGANGSIPTNVWWVVLTPASP